MSGSAAAAAMRLTALGDSLTAGFGLPAEAAFPVRLEAALRRRGHAVAIANAGVSGDTTAGGLARLEAVIADKPDGVILELGTNDALMGLPPARVRDRLAAMLTRLAEAGIPVLLCGARDLGGHDAAYAAAFAAIYPALAQRFRVVLDPFFLDGAFGHPELFQADGLHPNAAGVNAIVARLTPVAETFLARIGAAAASTAP